MNSLHRALAILNFIAGQDKPVSPKEIAAHLSIPLSTVYRLLHILKTWEMITYAQTYGTYTVGAHSLKTTDKYYRHSLPFRQLRPFMAKLSTNCKETVALLVGNLQETICVDIIEAERTLRCSFEIGKSNTLLRGASGKTFLAFCAEEYRNTIYTCPICLLIPIHPNICNKNSPKFANKALPILQVKLMKEYSASLHRFSIAANYWRY